MSLQQCEWPPFSTNNYGSNYYQDPLLSVKLFVLFPLLLSVRTPCTINPTVNKVLSLRKPCREETPLKRLQEQKEAEPGKVQEQSMYCKELLLSGATEFCFEELRAERYYAKKVAEEGGGQKGHPSPSASV